MQVLHPAFILPLDLHGKIWQYMELAEFVSILQPEVAFFVKAKNPGIHMKDNSTIEQSSTVVCDSY